MPKKITDLAVGGQAVIEGVMMRDANKTATAVRLPNGEIEVETHPVTSIRERYPVLNLPLIRGSVIMVESLVIGMRALSFSAQAAGEEDEQMTKKDLRIDVCSKCHPFFTGRQRDVQAGGRIEKFQKRYARK